MNTSDTAIVARSGPVRLGMLLSRTALVDRCGWNDLRDLPSEEIEKQLNVVGPLGFGSLGVVDEVKGPNAAKLSFARKRVLLPPGKRTQYLKIVRDEAKVVEGLVHTHIVHVFGTYEHNPKSGIPSFSLLMFPVGDGNLSDLLRSASSSEVDFDKTDIPIWLMQWFSCLSSALAFIHGHGVRHQDIKPSNIIHLREHVFFTDFSSSDVFGPDSTTSTESPVRSSAMYSAPEILNQKADPENLKRHGTRSDIFALGCVFMEMLAVIGNSDVVSLQNHLQEPKRDYFFRLVRTPTQRSFCYSHLIDGAVSFFKRMKEPQSEREHLYPLDVYAFFKEVISPMLKHKRKDRPSAVEVVSAIQKSQLKFSCACGHSSPKSSPLASLKDDQHGKTGHSNPKPPHLASLKDDRNGKMIEPKELRDLLESIRERYKLDREIWGLRDVNVANRVLVKQRMQRADAMLDHIQRTVISFDNRIYFESDEDYRAFLDIKARVMDRSKRVWGNRGPWLDSN